MKPNVSRGKHQLVYMPLIGQRSFLPKDPLRSSIHRAAATSKVCNFAEQSTWTVDLTPDALKSSIRRTFIFSPVPCRMPKRLLTTADSGRSSGEYLDRQTSMKTPRSQPPISPVLHPFTPRTPPHPPFPPYYSPVASYKYIFIYLFMFLALAFFLCQHSKLQKELATLFTMTLATQSSTFSHSDNRKVGFHPLGSCSYTQRRLPSISASRSRGKQ